MSSAGEAAPSKNKGEKTIWKVSATIANKRAMRRRGPGEIVAVSGFIPPAPLSNIIAHAQSSRMPKRVGTPHQVGLERMPGKHRKTCCPEYRLRAASKLPDGRQTRNHATEARFSGLILPAGLKQSIWGLGEAEFPKRRAARFTLLAGWCLTSNFRLGDKPLVARCPRR
jgi:hypothetical protein